MATLTPSALIATPFTPTIDLMDLESAKPKRAKRLNSTSKVALGATGVASLFGIGSTLASNITLNGGGNVEFGQGVAHQVACSKNGFSITPLQQFDNHRNLHRVTGLHISGIDMTPIGTNWDASGSGYSSGEQAQSLADHPGQYYNTSTNEWTPTCDNVVLDFQMYTNNPDYVQYTYNAYEVANGRTTTQTGINSPLLWHTELHNDGTVSYGANVDAAVVLRWNGSYYENNYGHLSSTFYSDSLSGYLWNGGGYYGANFDNPASASFNIAIDPAGWSCHDIYCTVQNDNYAPVAAAISSITVESMNYFPSGSINIGNNSDGAPGIRP